MNARSIGSLFSEIHNLMRNIDGLQPQEAFNELLKYLYFKQNAEDEGINVAELSEKDIKRCFTKTIATKESWLREVWRDKAMHLSNSCLAKINQAMSKFRLADIQFDIRSEAIKEFLTPQMRKGLGIFLTPDDVVKAMIEFVNPRPNAKILDLACGSGTFLLQCHYLYSERKFKLHGVDKNPKMLLLAFLNLGLSKDMNFHKELNDSLFFKESDMLRNETYDYIFTNPPFGVSLDARTCDFSRYETCKDVQGMPLRKQSSEIVFIEQSLDLLKPGGTLGIVIPKSIATNNSLQNSRVALSSKGFIYAILALPPETFATTGTQTTTIVLFIRKYTNLKEKNEKTTLALTQIENVGFDSTGRYRDGNQLDLFAKSLTSNRAVDDKIKAEIIEFEAKSETFVNLSYVFINHQDEDCIKLKDLCIEIGIGKTPARAAYSDTGVFLIKVGNLTGFGINWDARDRNYISYDEYKKRRKSYAVKKGDILMTSSAHSPIYIGKKVDIIDEIPSWIRHDVSYVGEVMLIRADPAKIDPYLLLAYLRAPSTMARIQKMVRGQTAHLHAEDLGSLSVPRDISKNEKLLQLSRLLKQQTELSLSLNKIVNQQSELLVEI
jgi:type I restriction enzyme M protein